MWHDGINKEAVDVRNYLHDHNGFNNPNIKDYFDCTYEKANYNLIHSTDSPLNDADWNQIAANTTDNTISSSSADAADSASNSAKPLEESRTAVDTGAASEPRQVDIIQNDLLSNVPIVANVEPVPDAPVAATDTTNSDNDSVPNSDTDSQGQDAGGICIADDEPQPDVRDDPATEADDDPASDTYYEHDYYADNSSIFDEDADDNWA